MTEQTPTTESTAAATKKPATVVENMDSYRIFANAELASNYLNKCMDDFADFAEHPLVLKGLDDAGNFDPAIYTESMNVIVACLRNKPGSENFTKRGKPVQAIVVNPIPSIESLLADETGLAFVGKILHKELNHVLMRPLRGVADVTAAEIIAALPTTREAFISNTRESSSLLEPFNNHYKSVSAYFESKVDAWKRRKPFLIKASFRDALESKAYALAHMPELEDRDGKQSYFVMALHLFISLAEKQGESTEIFTRWLETRDSKAYDFTATETEEDNELDDMDFSAVAGELIKPTPAPAPAA